MNSINNKVPINKIRNIKCCYKIRIYFIKKLQHLYLLDTEGQIKFNHYYFNILINHFIYLIKLNLYTACDVILDVLSNRYFEYYNINYFYEIHDFITEYTNYYQNY